MFVLPEPVGDPTWPASLVLCLGYMEDTKAQGTQKVVSSTLEDSCQSTFYFSNFSESFYHCLLSSFLDSSNCKGFAHSAGDLGSVLGFGRSPGEGNGNPLQYSCLENPMGREAWWATVHGVAELEMTEQLTHTHTE